MVTGNRVFNMYNKMDNFNLRKYLTEGKLLKENNSLDLMKEGIFSSFKKLTDPSRRPNDSEWELADKFAESENSKLASIGVNKKSGEIRVELDNGEQYILNKDGVATHRVTIDWGD